MTNKKASASQRMAAMAGLATQDIFLASDEDILAEAVEDGIDPINKAAELRSSALARIRIAKRDRLAKARESYDGRGSTPKAAGPRPSVAEIKKLVQRLIQSGASNDLALAFRKGEKLSDSDWEGLWDDLLEMGLVDDERPSD